MHPRLAILMSAYNCVEYIVEAIDSVLSQDYGNFQFYIVDDASTDGTFELLEELAQKDKRICLTHHQTRMGLTCHLNQLLQNVDTELVGRMDADDLSLPGRFREQIDYLDTHAEVGVLGTSTRILSSDGAWLYSYRLPSDHFWIANQLRAGQNVITHGSVIMRRKVLETLQPPVFRPPVAQDLDLWLRLIDHTTFAILPFEGYAKRLGVQTITYKYGHSRDQRKAYLLKIYEAERNGLPSPSIDEIQSTFATFLRDAEQNVTDAADIGMIIESYKNYVVQGQTQQARELLRNSSLSRRQQAMMWSLSWLPTTFFNRLQQMRQHKLDPLARYRVYPS